MKVPTPRIFLIGLSLILAQANAAANEVKITTLDGDGADVYVENNKGNFGSATLVVKNAARAVDDPHLTRKVYLRFDLSAYADRLADIENAGLNLMTAVNHLGGSTTDPRQYTVMVSGLTDESLDHWIENEVLWADAPANDLTNNELDPDKVVDLGTIDVPAVPDPDLVGYMSTALAEFIKTDTNGVITLILRRQDSDAANNLAFHSKESADGSTLEGILPTLTLTIGGEVLPIKFEEAINGGDLGYGIYSSPWFGRVRKVQEELFFTHLGWLWTGYADQPDNLWIWAYNLSSYIWMNSTLYPWVYIVDGGWTYVYNTPEEGTYLYLFNTGQWVAHNDFGWAYPKSNQELMDQLFINAASTPHPRILFTVDDLPELRQRVTRGWLVDAYAKLRTEVELLLRDGSLDISYSPSMGRRIHQTIAKVAFVGYMQDDPKYFDYAIDFALYQLDKYTLEELALNNPGSPHLGTGDVLHAYGIAYDWLYPYFNIIERSRIKNFLKTLGDIQYADVTSMWNGTDKVADSTNHNSVAHGGLGLAALALGNQTDWLERAVSQNRRYLEFSTDATGWNFEGRHYFEYGGWGAFPFSEAVVKLGGPDLLGEQPKYQQVPVDFFLRQMPPYDLPDGVPGTWPLIARYNDRVGLWLWLKTLGSEGDGSFGGARSDLDHSVYTLINGNPDLVPLDPKDAGLPLDKLFENGRATFRDGWVEDAAVLTYSTGWTMHTGHRMRSENSFNFYALNEEFSISPGDAQSRIASLHSMVMVDGIRNSRDAGEREFGSVVEAYRSEADYGYIRGDAAHSSAYFIDADGWKNPLEQKVSVALRQILFARSPDGLNEPYLVIVDDLTARADTAKFSWLLQTPAANTVEFGTDGDFTVTGHVNGARLDVDFIAPAGLTNEFLVHEGFVENKGRMTDAEIAAYKQTPAAVTNGKSVRFIVILRAHASGTTAPTYAFTGTHTDGQLTVQLSDGTTDVITIIGENMTFERTAP